MNHTYTILLTILLFAFPVRMEGQSPLSLPKVDGEILAHQKEKIRLKKVPKSENAKRLRSAGIRTESLDSEQCALYVGNPLTQREIEEYATVGIRIHQELWVPPVPGKHRNGFYLAEVEYSSLDRIETDARILRVESTEFSVKALNNSGAALIQVDDVRDGSGVTTARNGTGVNIAIADSGIDLSHVDFPSPVETYDMTDGTDTLSWGTNVANSVTDHGTHVAGTVLGRGTQSVGNVGNGGGAYQGSAPGANLYFYKIGDDLSGSASNNDIMEALVRAANVGCDIFTMSYGGFSSTYLDGSSTVCQTVDSVVAGGMLVFISAGNEAGSKLHDSVSVAPGATSGILNYTINNTSASTYTTPDWVRVIWRDDLPLSLNLTLSCSNLGAGESLVEAFSGTSTRQTEGKRYVLTPNLSAGASKTYQFTLTNSAASGTTPLVHLYNVAGIGTFDSADSSYTVAEPALADSAIAVGAWVHRKNWTNFLGTTYTFTANTQGTLAPFSSLGPRVDGTLKPDIVAPGAAVISTRDSTFSTSNTLRVDNDGSTLNGSGPADYYVKQGTSMACPMAAGAAALLLEENPAMTTTDVYSYLTSTASQSGGPDNSVGYGLINLVDAFGLFPTPTPTATPTATSTDSPTATFTDTPVDTPTHTPTLTPTYSPTNTETETPTWTATHTPTSTDTETPTHTSPPPTSTFTPTPTSTPTATETPTETHTDTPTASPTQTPSDTPTGTATWTATLTPTDTPLAPPTFTPTPTPTSTPTATSIPTLTPTPTEGSFSVENWELY